MMTKTEIAERAAIVIDGMYMFKTMRPRSVDGNKLSYVVYNDGCPYYSAPFERTTIMSFGGWVWRRHRCGTLMAYNGDYVLMVSPPTDMCLLTTSAGNQTDDTI